MTAARAAFERAAARLGIAPQALGVALATAAFIAISVWWLLYDKRPPAGGDPADHLATTMHVADLLRRLLSGDDVAVRVPEDQLPMRVRLGRRAARTRRREEATLRAKLALGSLTGRARSLASRRPASR